MRERVRERVREREGERKRERGGGEGGREGSREAGREREVALPHLLEISVRAVEVADGHGAVGRGRSFHAPRRPAAHGLAPAACSLARQQSDLDLGSSLRRCTASQADNEASTGRK